MAGIELHDAFVPAGTKAAPLPAVTVGPGAVWGHVYNAVTTKGARLVQGGGCLTVGVAGLVLGGGFGSYSRLFGTAAASLLEAEIVTADGVVRIANAATNPDLFWALKGGGGGTFGVVTRLTLRTHELPATAGFVNATIHAHSDAAFRRLIGRFVAFYAERLATPQWSDIVTIGRNNRFNISMGCLGLDQAQAETIWRPFFAWVAAAGDDYSFIQPVRVFAGPARQRWDPDFLRSRFPVRSRPTTARARRATTSTGRPMSPRPGTTFSATNRCGSPPLCLPPTARMRLPTRCSPPAASGRWSCISRRPSPAPRPRRSPQRATPRSTPPCSMPLCSYAGGFDGSGPGKNRDAAADFHTESPIKHVIILIGENRGLDHTFGVYKPKGKGQTISNILSKGIVNEDGTPGPNYGLAVQYAVSPQSLYYVGAPDSAKTPYSMVNLMPQPNTNGAPQTPYSTIVNTAGTNYETGPFTTIPPEPDIKAKNAVLLTTGATGLPPGTLDTRIPGAGTLPPGPFVLKGLNISDDDYTGDMTHRYYQAFQQQDCSIANATKDNPTGCLNDLFAFVMATYSATNKSAGNEMGFYNAEQEQASLLKILADRFTLSDNFHQSFLGGTGANHFMFGTGDTGFWSDGSGNAVTPPSNIANPNPKPGTVNTYIADNNFSNCSDATQPGVAPILDYLAALPYHPSSNCAAGHYYMLDNTNPGYLPNGYPVPAAQGALPPSPVKTIGDGLDEKKSAGPISAAPTAMQPFLRTRRSRLTRPIQP